MTVHTPVETVRYEVPLGDKLLITPLSGEQVALSGTPPWCYQIDTIDLGAVASGAVSGTALYQVLELTSGTFGPHVGKTLWLSIWSGTAVPAGSPHFVGRFHLSGIYEEFPAQKRLTGLLGENSIVNSPAGTDYQSGHLRHSRTVLYTSASLSTVLAEMDFRQRYVQDFVPDHRFFTDATVQEEV